MVDIGHWTLDIWLGGGALFVHARTAAVSGG